MEERALPAQSSLPGSPGEGGNLLFPQRVHGPGTCIMRFHLPLSPSYENPGVPMREDPRYMVEFQYWRDTEESPPPAPLTAHLLAEDMDGAQAARQEVLMASYEEGGKRWLEEQGLGPGHLHEPNPRIFELSTHSLLDALRDR